MLFLMQSTYSIIIIIWYFFDGSLTHDLIKDQGEIINRFSFKIFSYLQLLLKFHCRGCSEKIWKASERVWHEVTKWPPCLPQLMVGRDIVLLVSAFPINSALFIIQYIFDTN